MSRASQTTLCPCGHHVSSASPLSVPCDEFGFACAVGEATHLLITCADPSHGKYLPTFMIALADANAVAA